MNAGKLFVGILAGFAAGALVGVLFAPDKGTETRKKIVEAGEDYADVVKEKFNQVVDSMNEKFERVKEEGVSGAKKARKDIESAMI